MVVFMKSYWNVGVTVVAVLHEDLVNLLAGLLHMSPVVQAPNIWNECKVRTVR